MYWSCWLQIAICDKHAHECITMTLQYQAEGQALKYNTTLHVYNIIFICIPAVLIR